MRIVPEPRGMNNRRYAAGTVGAPGHVTSRDWRGDFIARVATLTLGYDDVDFAAKGRGDNQPDLPNITDMADRGARRALPARG